MKIKRGRILQLIKRTKGLSKRRKVLFGIVCFAVVLGLGFVIWGVTTGFFSSLAAGPQISNTATVAYEDLAGNSYSAQSNTALTDLSESTSTATNNTGTTTSNTSSTTDSSNSSKTSTKTAKTKTGTSAVTNNDTGTPLSTDGATPTDDISKTSPAKTTSFYDRLGLQPWAFWFLFGFIPLVLIGSVIYYFIRHRKNSDHSRLFSILLIVTMILSQVYFLSNPNVAKASSNQLFFYLSPTGDDNAAGTIDAPFASLEKARDAVKAQKNSLGANFHGATVYLRGGVYSRTTTFTLSAADSGTVDAPITYTAYRQERPIIRGSQTITGWTPSDANPNILQADLAAQGDSNLAINEVYFNGERQILARTPNYVTPDFSQTDPYAGTWNYASLENDCATVPAPGDNRVRKTTLIYNQADISAPTLDAVNQSLSLSPANPAQMELYSNTEYWNNIVNLAGVDNVNRQLVLASNASYDICAKNRYLLQNFYAALDTNKEWYQDRTANLLYYMPPQALTGNDRISVPIAPHAIVLNSVQYTTINGLTFEEFTGDVIVANSANNISIFNNTVRSSRDSGIVLYASSHDININWNLLYNLGNNGIYVENNGTGLTYIKSLTSSNIKINNNTIHDVAYINNGSIAIKTYVTVGVVVGHNEIYNLPRLAIGISGNDNIVEYNKIYDVNLLTKDSGGIYLGSRSWIQRGNIIRNNYIKDTNGYGKTPYGTGDGSYKLGNLTSGIYLDDYSSGDFVYNNIVVNAQSGCFQNHLGRDNSYTNNICIEGGFYTSNQVSFGEDTMADPRIDSYIVSMWDELQGMAANGYDQEKYFGRYPELANIVAPIDTKQGEIMVNNKVENNIFYYPAGPSPRAYAAGNLGTNQSIDNNLFWPGTRTITAGRNLTGTASVSTWAGWQALGFDVHSIVANPLFNDANVGTDGTMAFSLAANSPALAQGFEQIDTTKIGHPGNFSDLLVTTNSSLSSARSGDTITYNITAQNSGGTTLSNIVLSDPISAKTGFVSADNGGVFNANNLTVTWPAFDVGPDQTQTFTVRARVL